MYLKSDKFECLKEIASLDFLALDLHLYLNTHPMDKNALAKYNSLVMQCQVLKQQYESVYGMLSADSVSRKYPWEWINEPWPWEYEANYKLS